MEKKILLTLPLMAVLAVAAPAQEAAPSQASQPAEQQQTAQPAPGAEQQPATTETQAQPQTATGREPLAVRKEGFWGRINPFARKKYVQRQLDPVRGRLNELDELTAANARMIRDVDARATEGIRLAHNKASEADRNAIEAGNRAQLAQQTATQANQRLETVQHAVENVDQYQPVTTAEIRFRSGQNVLSRRAKEALDEIAEPLRDQKGYIIEVQGFSSGSGHAAIENSRNMAESVVRYLVLNHEIPVYRIYTVGMGNAPMRTEDGKPKRIRGGRVEISLLKNPIADMNAQAAQSSSVPAGGENMSGAAALPQGEAAPAAQPQEQQPEQVEPEQPQR